jgi:hypothetical protein
VPVEIDGYGADGVIDNVFVVLIRVAVFVMPGRCLITRIARANGLPVFAALVELELVFDGLKKADGVIGAAGAASGWGRWPCGFGCEEGWAGGKVLPVLDIVDDVSILRL